MSSKRQIEKAARRFYNAIAPAGDQEWFYGNSPVKALVLTAFEAYDKAWAGTEGFNISQWVWPFTELEVEREKGGAFKGDQPWAVLFRHAVSIAPDYDGHVEPEGRIAEEERRRRLAPDGRPFTIVGLTDLGTLIARPRGEPSDDAGDDYDLTDDIEAFGEENLSDEEKRAVGLLLP